MQFPACPFHKLELYEIGELVVSKKYKRTQHARAGTFRIRRVDAWFANGSKNPRL